MFIGRNAELQILKDLKKKKTASLICVLGRRRIGKSSLIEEFGKSFSRFISIQGLGPEEASSMSDQLEHFAEKISEHFNSRKEHFNNWSEAFSHLASKTAKGESLILLDEISWMGRGDPLFSSRIKEAWDTKFKKNNKLILVLCGSVSSWINENILSNTGFEGRISSEINLTELTLLEINEFWKRHHYQMGSFEKIQILSITGGVPKYLEEVLKTQTAEKNILRLCYEKNGLLFNDFKKIFKDILGRRTKNLEKIVRICLEKKVTPKELALAMKVPLNGDLIEAINILELSGFVNRDYYFNPNGNVSRLSHIRIKDNYLRFYLKYIEPLSTYILKGGKKIESLNDIKGWSSIMGLQFENLILHNRSLVLKQLDIKSSQLISAAPYTQNKKTTNKGACQIDLLIHTQLDIFYLCEIKCRKVIDASVIAEVKQKVSVLQVPKRSSLKTVLIYEGEISAINKEKFENYFYKLISFTDLLS